jgi:uncharacterized protein
MLCLISPAKTLDFETPRKTPKPTQPEFLKEAETLIRESRKLSVKDIQELMGVSEKIAELNHDRFKSWERPFDEANARPSIMAFKGDVYEGLEPWTLKSKDLQWLQKRLMILSGLYGLLKPLDLMQAYRLEMGLAFSNPKGKNLYHYWGDQLTERVDSQEKELIVNLASNEYFKAIKSKSLRARLVTPQFKDWKNGQYKMISFFAKKARGRMIRYIVDERVEKAEQLLNFNLDGYIYNEELSKKDQPVFTRAAP